MSLILTDGGEIFDGAKVPPSQRKRRTRRIRYGCVSTGRVHASCPETAPRSESLHWSFGAGSPVRLRLSSVAITHEREVRRAAHVVRPGDHYR